MPVQPRYTNIELAEQLRLLADHASEPEKSRLLNLAELFGREGDLIQGSRTAIAESNKLLTDLDKLLPRL